MCYRKIITAKKEWTVPLLNGCSCPMIKEFRHVSPTENQPRRTYSLPNYCFDIHTSIPIEEIPDHHVVFRNCICNHFTGMCMKLPALIYQLDDKNNDEVFAEYENDDDDEDESNSFGGNMGIRPRNHL